MNHHNGYANVAIIQTQLIKMINVQCPSAKDDSLGDNDTNNEIIVLTYCSDCDIPIVTFLLC